MSMCFCVPPPQAGKVIFYKNSVQSEILICLRLFLNIRNAIKYTEQKPAKYFMLNNC